MFNIKNKIKILLNILCIIEIIFIQKIFAAGQIRSISIKPEYLCPGQTVTITFEARHELGRQIYAAGVFSTNSTWDGNDYLWLWSNYPTVKTPFDTWDSTKYCSSPSEVTIYLPYTFTVTVPSAFTEGSTVYIIIKVGENFWTVGSAGDDMLAQAFEVNCRKTNAYNRANLWYQQSLPAKLIIEDCLTPSNTPTNTRTSTRTNTPTNTITNTSTNTFTNTPTNTLTYTRTNTLTNSPTNTETFTRTFTSTNTITNTFTNTQTNTLTNTRTNTITDTPTNTITNTRTNTITNTTTFTFTNTQTNTPTNTGTNTFTNTYTNTQTQTPTRTYTPTTTWTGTQPPTWTPTDTFTNTNTATRTFTRTNTLTFSVTNTNSSTNTSTYTVTVTNTRTNTNTFTETATGTQPPTFTFTNTPTNSLTRTNTLTFTMTNTQTNTNTATVTRTATNTFTETVTGTQTFTFTFTNTLTNSATRTNTFTFTNTNTLTYTNTSTYTPTNTSTFTNTSLPTSTPTITLTLPPFPYTITIGIYNEAGEIIRKIITTPASALIENMILKVGDEETTVVDTKKELKIILPGIETPENLGNQAAVFIWDLKNNNGQIADNGVYYIKIEQKDGYGHTNILIKNIQVLNIDEYVELKIFNSAGEIVNIIKYDKIFEGNNVFLKVNDVIAFGNGNQEITIRYGDEIDDNIKWDGKNAQGLLVTSGIYEMQIIVKKNNDIKTISKTVKIFSFGKKYLNDLKVTPNPYKGQKDKIKFIWDTEVKGKVFIKIYNIAGEIIRILEGRLEDEILNWDVKTSTGALVSSGFYIYTIEAKAEDGYIDIIKSKLAILNN